MRIVKRSARMRPKVSLVLLDWSVRESFHLLHYLKNQTVARDAFEVIVVEFYSRVSDAVGKFADMIDTWVVLDMPTSCYYHKHLMYNVGIVLARGEIVMIGDSDAMAKPSFIEAIIRNFERDPAIIYHMDEFRNQRRDFYPFNYPSFEAVLGEGCFNNSNGRTTGVLDKDDLIHTRNYGACMCARRADLVAIGGADMHIDYVGHICGPYDMTFRLTNYGRREVWDMDEFLYHTWHPGQAGADNYMGPHDGRHMSTTALEAVTSRRVRPLLEHEAIRRLRTGAAQSAKDVIDVLIDPRHAVEWDAQRLNEAGVGRRWSDYRMPMGVYRGYRLEAEVDRVFAYAINQPARQGPQDGKQRWVFDGPSVEAVRRQIDHSIPLSLAIVAKGALGLKVAARAGQSLRYRSRQIPGPLSNGIKLALAALLAVPAVLVAAVVQPRRLIRKVRSVMAELDSSSGTFGTLVVLLHGLNASDASPDGEPKTLVLADDPQTTALLPMLAKLGLLPRLEARNITDAAAIEACLRELERTHWTGRLVIAGMLYLRFHATIAASPMAGRAIIV